MVALLGDVDAQMEGFESPKPTLHPSRDTKLLCFSWTHAHDNPPLLILEDLESRSLHLTPTSTSLERRQPTHSPTAHNLDPFLAPLIWSGNPSFPSFSHLSRIPQPKILQDRMRNIANLTPIINSRDKINIFFMLAE